MLPLYPPRMNEKERRLGFSGVSEASVGSGVHTTLASVILPATKHRSAKERVAYVALKMQSLEVCMV